MSAARKEDDRGIVRRFLGGIVDADRGDRGIEALRTLLKRSSEVVPCRIGTCGRQGGLPKQQEELAGRLRGVKCSMLDWNEVAVTRTATGCTCGACVAHMWRAWTGSKVVEPLSSCGGVVGHMALCMEAHDMWELVSKASVGHLAFAWRGVRWQPRVGTCVGHLSSCMGCMGTWHHERWACVRVVAMSPLYKPKH